MKNNLPSQWASRPNMMRRDSHDPHHVHLHILASTIGIDHKRQRISFVHVTIFTHP